MAAEIVCIGGHEARDFDCDRVGWVVEGGQDGLLAKGKEFRFRCDDFGHGLARKGRRSECKAESELGKPTGSHVLNSVSIVSGRGNSRARRDRG
jgi:hypothetical protein